MRTLSRNASVVNTVSTTVEYDPRMAYDLADVHEAVIRVEGRLEAQDGREADRERLMRFMISEAVMAGTAPLAERVSSLEKDRERAKAYAATVVFLAGVVAWIVEKVT